MNNSIEISAQFDFKGETFRPTATLDLDRLMQQRGDEEVDFHHLLAMENGIDFYSYQYDVLESTMLEFANPTGFAGECLADGIFDFAAFRLRWQEQRELEVLQEIASRHMGVDDLQVQPSLQAALLEAYRLGRKS